MCGEELSYDSLAASAVGSPPRVRGGDRQDRYAPVDGRITPACAGRSCPGLLNLQWYRDHPRVCGEECGRLRVPLRD